MLASCQKVSLKNPKFPTSKKFSAFSLKEIDRSLLLEDFLRKSENVYSGDFLYSEENLCVFEGGSGPTYKFFYSLIFCSSSCGLWMLHGPYS